MDTTKHLTQLEARGLIGVAATHPELEYLFRHVMLQDAAYQSLLKQERKRLHRLVGEILEQSHSHNAQDVAPVLARHFDEAGDGDQALIYYAMAGDAAARRYANAEAAMHYTRAIELMRLSPKTPQQITLQYLYISRGQALELNGMHLDALKNYEELRDFGQQHGDRHAELEAFIKIASLYASPSPLHNLGLAEPMLAEALALARALNDRTAECKVLWNLLLLNIYAGRRELAADYGEQGLTLARELNDLSQRAFLLNDAGTNYYILSKFQRSREILREAQSLWRQLDNRVMLGDSLNWEAMSAWYMGETEQSISLTEEAFVGAESIDNQWGVAFACAICAYPLAMSGKMDLALERLLLGQAIGNKLNLLGSVIPIHVQLARALIFLGDYSSALQAAQVAIDAANTTLPLWRAWALSGLIYVRLAQGDLPEVERLIAEARQALKREHFSAPHTIWQIDLSEISLALIQNNPSRAVTLANTLLNYLREIGARSHLPETYLLKGRALLAQNQVQAAHRILEDALIEAKSVQAYSVVWEIMSVLGEVEAARGENETAEAWRRQARQIVAALAENISRADVRQSFLNRTDIRKLMSKE